MIYVLGRWGGITVTAFSEGKGGMLTSPYPNWLLINGRNATNLPFGRGFLVAVLESKFGQIQQIAVCAFIKNL